jgi:hypothetical protein
MDGPVTRNIPYEQTDNGALLLMLKSQLEGTHDG